jgi:hypothetical protein
LREESRIPFWLMWYSGVLVFWCSGLAPRKTRFRGPGTVCTWHVARGYLDFWRKNEGSKEDSRQVRGRSGIERVECEKQSQLPEAGHRDGVRPGPARGIWNPPRRVAALRAPYAGRTPIPITPPLRLPCRCEDDMVS